MNKLKNFFKKVYNLIFEDHCTICAASLFAGMVLLTWFILAMLFPGMILDKIIMATGAIWFFREGFISLRELMREPVLSDLVDTKEEIDPEIEKINNFLDKNSTVYYAKYLPKENGYSRVVKSSEGIPYDTEIEVELFLCTNSIQKGDKIIVTDSKIKNKFINEVAEHIEDYNVGTKSGIAYDIKYCHKKIGKLKDHLKDVFKEGILLNIPSLDTIVDLETDKTNNDDTSNRKLTDTNI